MVNFEVVSCDKYFLNAEAGGGTSGIIAISSRPEVADDNISNSNVETFRDYYGANLWVARLRCFPENRNQPPM